MENEPVFKVIGEEPEAERFRMCRRMLVGPWCNQPEQYEGYNGFVGWAGVTRLGSGRWVVTFTSGFWHGSLPQTEEILRDEECRKIFDRRHDKDDMQCPRIHAPRGGRAHIMTSDDEGVTWSRPATLVDTEMDDRHPTILELDDGTLFCSFFCAPPTKKTRAMYMVSNDGGETWTQPTPVYPGAVGFGNGSAIQLSDGSVAWAIGGNYDEKHEFRSTGIFLSSDNARTFELAAVVSADHDLHEATIAELTDGRLVLVARRESDICWSADGGHTWTEPAGIGVDLFDPHLLLMPNGVLACFHGSYKSGGIRVILSPDGGETWHGPGDCYGYGVDLSVYGYCHAMLLPDGTAYLVYLHTGGHRAADARTEALWALRVKVHDEADGVDILPAPGSPEARGLPREILDLLTRWEDGGDPALGALL